MTTTESSTTNRTTDEIDELSAVLDEVIDEGRRKLTGNGRIRDEEKEKCRIKWANAVVRAAKTRQKLIETRDLAEMQDEIEELKAQKGWR